MAGKRFPLLFLLQGALGLFFLFQGLHGIVAFGSSSSEISQALSRTFGGRVFILELLIVLIQLGCGAVLTAALFMKHALPFRKHALTAVMVLWIALMVVFDLLLPNFHSRYFNLLLWAQQLSMHLVIFISILLVRRKG